MDRDLNQQSHAEHEAKAGIKVPVLELILGSFKVATYWLLIQSLI